MRKVRQRKHREKGNAQKMFPDGSSHGTTLISLSSFRLLATFYRSLFLPFLFCSVHLLSLLLLSLFSFRVLATFTVRFFLPFLFFPVHLSLSLSLSPCLLMASFSVLVLAPPLSSDLFLASLLPCFWSPGPSRSPAPLFAFPSARLLFTCGLVFL